MTFEDHMRQICADVDAAHAKVDRMEERLPRLMTTTGLITTCVLAWTAVVFIVVLALLFL